MSGYTTTKEARMIAQHGMKHGIVRLAATINDLCNQIDACMSVIDTDSRSLRLYKRDLDAMTEDRDKWKALALKDPSDPPAQQESKTP